MQIVLEYEQESVYIYMRKLLDNGAFDGLDVEPEVYFDPDCMIITITVNNNQVKTMDKLAIIFANDFVLDLACATWTLSWEV